MSEYFLDNHGEEIESHALIVGDNLKAMQKYAKQIEEKNSDFLERVELQTTVLCKCIEDKVKHAKVKLNSNEIASRSRSISHQIQEKEKSIKNLKDDLNNLNEQFEKYKLDQENLYRTNKSTLSALQKGLKHYMKYFQYKMDTEDLADATKYCVVITFLVNGKESKHPIKFIFDCATDNLIEFEANTLLTQEQHQSLINSYKESHNKLALLCALRNKVLMKEDL